MKNKSIYPIRSKIYKEQSSADSFHIKIKPIYMFVISVSLLILLFISIGFGALQYNENNKLRENDLKYRYIKMIGGINPTELDVLENLFNNPENKRIINKMYNESTLYEQRVRSQMEIVDNLQNKR